MFVRGSAAPFGIVHSELERAGDSCVNAAASRLVVFLCVDVW